MAVPTNTVAPAITGTAAYLQQLAGSNGSWTGTPNSYAYQWQIAEVVRHNGSIVVDDDDEIVTLDWADITGETAATFTCTRDELAFMLRIEVIASNGDGASEPAYSEQVGPVFIRSGQHISAALSAGLSPADERLILLIGT